MEEVCTSAKLNDVAESSTPWYLAIQVGDILTCAVAFCLNTWLVRIMYALRKSKLSKFLMVFTVLFSANCYSYCLVFMGIESYHVLSRLSFTGCDLMITAGRCVIPFRLILSFNTVYFLLHYPFLCVGLFLNSFSKRFRDFQYSLHCMVGLLLSTCFVIISLSYPMDFFSDTPMVNCATFENKSEFFLKTTFTGACVINFLSVLGFFVLYNRKNYEILPTPVSSLQSTRAINHRDMKVALNLMLPNFNLHTLLLSVYSSSGLYLVYWGQITPLKFLSINTIPLLTLLGTANWIRTFLHYQKNNPKQPVKMLNETNNNQTRPRTSSTILFSRASVRAVSPYH